MATFHLSIITPDGLVFDDHEVTALVAPGEEGSFGVMAHHAHMITALKPGVLTVRDDEATRLFAVGAGVLEASRNHVSILADSAEEAPDLETANRLLLDIQSPWHTQPLPR